MANNKPICKVDEVGSKRWYLNGFYHRKNGPAIIFSNGTKFWYLNGQRHREDGPAIEIFNGKKAWFLNGNHCYFQDYLKELKKMGKSDKEIMLIALKYG
jgi:hypothetical protein